jgi:hypothetical protein
MKSGKRWDAILKRLPKDKKIIGAEIGVWQGKTSAKLLAGRLNLTLYMIDPWVVPKKESSYYKSGDDNARKNQAQHNKDYHTTLKKVKFAGDRAIIKKMYSHEFVKLVKNDSLYFVFIDGDHSYDGCRIDIQMWLPKIKIGGFISGHDYNHPRLPGVRKAVDEFFLKKDIQLDVNRTWFVRIYA